MSFRENLTLTERWKIKTSSIIRHPGVCSESLLLGDTPLGSLVTACSLTLQQVSAYSVQYSKKAPGLAQSDRRYRVREGVRAGASRETAVFQEHLKKV